MHARKDPKRQQNPKGATASSMLRFRFDKRAKMGKYYILKKIHTYTHIVGQVNTQVKVH